MDEGKLKELLNNVKNGRLEIEEAVNSLRKLPFEDIGFARIDHHRHIRCGFPEVIYCPGKDTDHIVKIFQKLAETGHNVLATRAEEHIYEAIKNSGIADAEYEKLGRTISLRQQMPKNKPEGYITVVTAGTADIPVAMEAKVTAELCGQNVEFICDVGVAGLHRIVDKIELLQKSNVVIAVAGMEGALVSVVGGLVSCPVIAVPTSIGYGASFGGVAALLAMLNSCASGVTVVNIDNGFSAGYTAAIINSRTSKWDK
ncbi:MAG: nickel pincer cofactor biosynthesis protein LarB [Sedimentisphaeraceae bacterium JB056]